ncbi:uncharacterized protein N7479_006309, partial [Penicillium vulpinum]|uniref:uncharacterized protein n=1 Tax=Penicillium vulpinum TaxID=29845 RepID=UPI0025474865
EYNILASLAHWILLAGYLVIPGIFILLQKSDTLKQGLLKDKTREAILNTIQNPPLLATASVLFMIAGLLTTIVNIYTAKDGDWSIIALLTFVALSLSVASSAFLIYIYKFRKLKIVIEEHYREIEAQINRYIPKLARLLYGAKDAL